VGTGQGKGVIPCSFTQWTPNNHDQLLIIIPLRSLAADIKNALSGALADGELLVLCSAQGSDEKDHSTLQLSPLRRRSC
jgi:hypothetical protein